MIRPIYRVGDRVAHVCQRTGFNYFGIVTKVIMPGQIDDSLLTPFRLKWYTERDKDFRNNPFYVVKPDSSPGPMTYAEAQALLPGKFGPEDYERVFNDRVYHCLESDLILEEEASSKGVIIEVNAIAANPDDLADMLIHIAVELRSRLALKDRCAHYRHNTCAAYAIQRSLFPLEIKQS